MSNDILIFYDDTNNMINNNDNYIHNSLPLKMTGIVLYWYFNEKKTLPAFKSCVML